MADVKRFKKDPGDNFKNIQQKNSSRYSMQKTSSTFTGAESYLPVIERLSGLATLSKIEEIREKFSLYIGSIDKLSFFKNIFSENPRHYDFKSRLPPIPARNASAEEKDLCKQALLESGKKQGDYKHDYGRVWSIIIGQCNEWVMGQLKKCQNGKPKPTTTMILCG